MNYATGGACRENANRESLSLSRRLLYVSMNPLAQSRTSSAACVRNTRVCVCVPRADERSEFGDPSAPILTHLDDSTRPTRVHFDPGPLRDSPQPRIRELNSRDIIIERV